MKPANKLWLALILVNVLAAAASASAIIDMVNSMKTLAYSLGWLMMVIMGVKWIIADSPNERADAKKGMIYVIIGVLVVKSSCELLSLYCTNVTTALGPTSGFTCPMGQFGCGTTTT